MRLATLPVCSVKLLPDRLFQATVIVTGDEVNIPQSSFFQATKEVAPGFFTFSVCDGKSPESRGGLPR